MNIDGKGRVETFKGRTILHYTAYDNLPGAAKSAYNIHKTFEANGAKSKMVVLRKKTEDPSVIEAKKGIIYYLQFGIKLYKSMMSSNKGPKYALNDNRKMYINVKSLLPYQSNEVDLIFIYWIKDYLNTTLQQKILEYYNCPIVWVLMDMEPITGGCHQSMGCKGYTASCGNCMIIDSDNSHDLTHKTWARKRLLNTTYDVTFVAPTNGLLSQVKNSTLAEHSRIAYIPLAVETDIYRPVKMESARELIAVPMDKIVICFGANNIRSAYKGVSYLEKALDILSNKLVQSGKLDINKRILVLLAGGNKGNAFENSPFDIHYIGRCKDIRTMALMFQASDMYVCPSIYDGGPVMIPEAMMCGTPVVAFNTGGASDLIENEINGYIAEYMNSEDLARGIERVIDTIDSNEMRINARNAAKRNNTPEHVAVEYCKLLEEILSSETDSQIVEGLHP